MILTSLPAEAPVTEAPTRLDNILTLSLVGLIVLVLIIAVIRKAVSNKKAANVVVEEVAAPVADAPTAPGSAGKLKTYDVAPKTVAMLMAITADKLQKPLNELKFVSIKEVK